MTHPTALVAGLAALAFALAPAVARADDAPAPEVAPAAEVAPAPEVAAYAPAYAAFAPQGEAPAPPERRMRSPKMFGVGLGLHGVAIAAGIGTVALVNEADRQQSSPRHADGAGMLPAMGAVGLGAIGIAAALAAIPITIIGSTPPSRRASERAAAVPTVAVGPGSAVAGWQF